MPVSRPWPSFRSRRFTTPTGATRKGEAILRDLIDHPTTLVSKDQATITLARYLIIKRPAEARKLLDPLKTVGGPVGQLALSLYGQLPP
jgi:hypothetical protein